MSSKRATTQISEIATVVVPVSDQDRALDFYVGKLGFEQRSDIPFGRGMRRDRGGAGGSPTVLAISTASGRPGRR